jgi:hypothetical protein
MSLVALCTAEPLVVSHIHRESAAVSTLTAVLTALRVLWTGSIYQEDSKQVLPDPGSMCTDWL